MVIDLFTAMNNRMSSDVFFFFFGEIINITTICLISDWLVRSMAHSIDNYSYGDSGGGDDDAKTFIISNDSVFNNA